MKSILLLVFCVLLSLPTIADSDKNDKPFKVANAPSDLTLTSYPSEFDDSASFTLNRSFRKLSFVGELKSPTSEKDVPTFKLHVDRSKIHYEGNIMFTVSDEECTGEYTVEVRTRSLKGDFQYFEFDTKVLWPEDFEVGIEYLGKKSGSHSFLFSLDGEVMTVVSDQPPKFLNFDMRLGRIDISEIDFLEK